MTSMMMWFGTEERMQWVPIPQSGADVSPQNWNANGTLLDGGGYSFNSFGSHKQYQFSWDGASAIKAAQTMENYASGTYGEGLIYFQDPLTYRQNVLPAHWADPSLALRGAPKLYRSLDLPVTKVVTPNPGPNELPLYGVKYDLSQVGPAYPQAIDTLFIPVPPGMNLAVGAIYTATGTGAIYAHSYGGTDLGVKTTLTRVAPDAEIIAPDIIQPGTRGVRLYLGTNSLSASNSVTIHAIVARLVIGDFVEGVGYGEGEYGGGVYGGAAHAPGGVFGPWAGGQGNSGCRFVGHPTRILISGINGGQVQYATTLKEVGPWMVG